MSTLKVNAVIDASGGNTATINSMTPTADSLQGFRNRIINGAMMIAQRGTSAVTSSGSYPVDRFSITNTTDGAFSAQQDATAPTGFVNSLKYTVTTADSSLASTQVAFVRHKIEGTNVSDLAWGSASAKTVTLSFQVRSSVTGTFGGALRNSADDRSYPFTYSISSANTWETKSVTIAGDTSGTWLTTTGIGIQIIFSLGSGSSRVGTAGVWAAAEYTGATGETNLMATLNATWYITGAQLEVGSVATPFERRDYGRELIMCQRYFVSLSKPRLRGVNNGTNCQRMGISLPVTMRASPTVSFSGTIYFYNGSNTGTGTVVSATYSTADSFELDINKATGASILGTPELAYVDASNTSVVTGSSEL